MEMIGWRARLGFLVPPGNPTVEAEMITLAPEGVSLHFHRMVAHGIPGSLEGQSERNRSMVENIDNGIELLAMVKPDVIVVAHTATSYHLGRRAEADLLDRLERSTGRRGRHRLRFGGARAGAAQYPQARAGHAVFG